MFISDREREELERRVARLEKLVLLIVRALKFEQREIEELEHPRKTYPRPVSITVKAS